MSEIDAVCRHCGQGILNRRAEKAEARVKELETILRKFAWFQRGDGRFDFRVSSITYDEADRMHRLVFGTDAATPLPSVCTEPTPDGKTCVLEKGHNDYLGHWSHDAGGMLRTSDPLPDLPPDSVRCPALYHDGRRCRFVEDHTSPHETEPTRWRRDGEAGPIANLLAIRDEIDGTNQKWLCGRCEGASDLDHSPRCPKRGQDLVLPQLGEHGPFVGKIGPHPCSNEAPTDPAGIAQAYADEHDRKAKEADLDPEAGDAAIFYAHRLAGNTIAARIRAQRTDKAVPTTFGTSVTQEDRERARDLYDRIEALGKKYTPTRAKAEFARALALHRARAEYLRSETAEVWAVTVETEAADVLCGLFSTEEKARAYMARFRTEKPEQLVVHPWVIDGVAVPTGSEDPR